MPRVGKTWSGGFVVATAMCTDSAILGQSLPKKRAIHTSPSRKSLCLWARTFPTQGRAPRLGSQDPRMTPVTAKTPRLLDQADLANIVGGAFMQGHAGTDTLTGTAQGDAIFGGGGNDVLAGGAGNDQAYGEAGNDAIRGGYGDDRLDGGYGNDSLDGGSGRDAVFGGDGNDSLDGGVGDAASDTAEGGGGNDVFVWAPGDGSDDFRGGTGQDTLNVLDMTLAELKGAVQVEGGADLRMVETSSGVSFVNAAGDPVAFTGTIAWKGETLRFADIERIMLG